MDKNKKKPDIGEILSELPPRHKKIQAVVESMGEGSTDGAQSSGDELGLLGHQ